MTFLERSINLSPEPASELRWPAHPNADSSSIFFFSGFLDVVYSKYLMCCQAARASKPGICRNMAADCKERLSIAIRSSLLVY